VLVKWIDRWTGLADEAALGLGTILEAAGSGVAAAAIAGHARAARQEFLAGLVDAASEAGTARAG
jgi:hypothetical protein